MKYKEDDIVFCTVKKIEGTTVFLEVGDGTLATMVFSEVAAGRIRNLREYVPVHKKVVCKVLKVAKDHLELSLRRVTTREREQVLERYKKERSLSNMLTLVGEKPAVTIQKIKEKYGVVDFFDEARKHPEIIQQFMDKDKATLFAKIIIEKEGKDKVVTTKIILKSFSEQGAKDIKEVLAITNARVRITYIGSSSFIIYVNGRDFKEANITMEGVLEDIEKKAKEKKVEFLLIKEGK